MDTPSPDPVLDLALQLMATANAHCLDLDLSPYQAIGACVLALCPPQTARLPGVPEAALRVRHVRRHAVPASAAAAEQKPRYPMLALGPWVVSLSGEQGYEQILARHNQEHPDDPMSWTDTTYDHDAYDALRSLGSRQPAFFQLVEQLQAQVQQWSMEQSTSMAPPRRLPAPRL